MSGSSSELDAVDSREPQVAEQCSLLKSAIENLNGVVDKFETRLERVLRTSADPDSVKDEMKLMEICPLANWIREERFKIETLDDILSGLINRIEL